jgi:hypothetical protein
MRRRVKRLVGAAAVGGLAYAVWRAWRARVPERPRDIEWASAPFPFPPIPRPVSPVANTAATPAATPEEQSPWAEPNGDGSCPPGFPIKGKRSSGIYHVPGGANYDRTKPDRCYADEDAARRDGLRRAKA